MKSVLINTNLFCFHNFQQIQLTTQTKRNTNYPEQESNPERNFPKN